MAGRGEAGLAKKQISVPQSRLVGFQWNPLSPFLLVAEGTDAQCFPVLSECGCGHMTSSHQRNGGRSNECPLQANVDTK